MAALRAAVRAGRGSEVRSGASLPPAAHAGVTHNLKLSRGMFRQHAAAVSALLEAYFAGNGTQMMITVSDRQELERAMENLAAYNNLVVRVGGYSERFVNLPREVQLEVLRRTLY